MKLRNFILVATLALTSAMACSKNPTADSLCEDACQRQEDCDDAPDDCEADCKEQFKDADKDCLKAGEELNDCAAKLSCAENEEGSTECLSEAFAVLGACPYDFD